MRGAGARAVVAGVVAVELCSCGGSTAVHPHRVSRSPVVEAQARHEYPSPAPPRQTAAGTSTTAAEAVAAFVRAYINWDANTVSADMRQLAAHSIGEARAATQLAAAETAGDYELQRGGIANSGTIEAISPLAGQPFEYVVVTRELTTATATTAYEGLRPAWHVAIVTVTEVGTRGWVVSGWQPQS